MFLSIYELKQKIEDLEKILKNENLFLIVIY